MAGASSRTLSVRRFGANGMPAILFIPGFADDGSMFAPLAETKLASLFRLIVPDLPGFGRTPPLKSSTTLQALASTVCDLVESERAQIVVAHSLGSIIASLAARRCPHLISTIISLEGNLTADDAYYSGMAADFDSATAFRRALLERLGELATEQPIIARYRSIVSKADVTAMWELGCDARAFSATCVPGDVLREACKVCYLYNPANCPPMSLEWLQCHPIPKVRMDGATHWASVDHPHTTAQHILEALMRLGN